MRRVVLLMLVLVLLASCIGLVACVEGDTDKTTETPEEEERITPSAEGEVTPAPTEEKEEVVPPAAEGEVTPAPTEEEEEEIATPGEAEILSHSSYIAPGQWRELFGDKVYKGEFLHIVGEISNTGSVNIRDFNLDAEFLDSTRNVIELDGPTHLDQSPDLLTPGEKAPFLLVLLDEKASEEAARYQLFLEFSDTTKEPYRIKIMSDRSFVDENGTYKVVGEIQNTGNENLEQVKIYGTFYDESGRVIYLDYTYSDINGLGTITPGQKSPFYLSSSGLAGGVATGYSVYTDCRTTNRSLYRGLEILSNDAGLDYFGKYQIEGQIRNVGDNNVKFVKIVATLYRADNTVYAADFTYADPSELGIGETGQFKISGFYYSGIDVDPEQVKSYHLEFDCMLE
jgi:hypothetical protein